MIGNRISRRPAFRRFVWLIVTIMTLALMPVPATIAFDQPEPNTPIQFLRKDNIFVSPNGDAVTTVAYGPDGRIYVGTVSGTIYGLTMDGARNVTNVEQINTIRNTPNFNDDGQPAPSIEGRLILGMTVDPQSTPAQPILYVAHSDPRQSYDAANPATHIDIYSGTITRLTGPNFDAPASRLDVVTGLPRSRKNHATNGITFGPDGWLYIAQGGNTDLGAANDTWGSLPEQFLSAAILRADVRTMTSGLDVRHVTSSAHLIPLQGEFEMYATGFRNAYDLVWHSDGYLYVNENGANVYQGSTPGPQHGCPDTQAIVPDPQHDALFRVTEGMHAGHPNPARGQCVFRDGSLYSPPESPDPNYQPPLRDYNSNQGEVSMDGIIEYPVGPMAGDLVSATFSGTKLLVRKIFNPDGSVTIARIDEVGKFSNPLDLAVDPEGVIYIAEYGISGAPGISVLIPENIAAPELTLTNVSPNTGSTAGGTIVTLSGTLFESGATVTFGGVAASNVTVASSTSITATTPAHAAGSVSVTVSNPGGESATLTGGFTYTNPGGGASLLRVNAGGGMYTDSNSNVWSADTGFSGGSSYSTTQTVSGTTDSALYQSEHYGNTTYSFAMEDGNYLVNLKFAEIYWSNPGQRVFDVSINGQLVLDNFDILAETAPLTALDKSFPVTVTSGNLNITLTTVVDNAKISAIEITSGGGGNDTTPPEVAAVSPQAGTTNVPVAESVSVTFSEPMNQAATQAAFSLSPSHTGSFSWNQAGTTLTFTPLAAVGKLQPNTLYTAMVAMAATDIAGNQLSEPYSWTFTTEDDTDTTPPEVVSTNPANGATGVATSSTISVSFSEPMFQAVTEDAFSLSPSHAGTFSWNGAGTTMTFTPNDDLAEDETYTVTISTGAMDQANNALANPVSWSFTTAGSTGEPAPNVASITPNSGPIAGGTSVTLSGSNFAAGATVTIGGTAATNVSVVNATTITATTPAHAAGAVDVTVTNPDSQSSTLSGGFTYTGGGTGGTRVFGINAGGTSYTDSAGAFWYGDAAYSGGGTFAISSAISGTTDDTLYQSERYGNFSYSTPVDNGDYVVTLKFAEIYWTNPGQRVFDVTINGQLVLDNFDILTEASKLTALDKSIPVTVTNGNLLIAFAAVTDNAKVSAITVSTADGGGQDTTPPTVIATNPADDATNVDTSSPVIVTFSEPMNKAATESAFSLSPNLTGSFTWNGAGTVITFNPASDLTAETLYTVEVSTAAMDLAGNPLASAVTWSFTTAETADTTPPTVVSTNPSDDATSVALDSNIVVTFSEPMNQAATQAALSASPTVAGAFSWNGAGTVMTFNPTGNLAEDTLYTVTVSTGATDTAGNALASQAVWSFTTVEPAPAPAPVLTGITPNSGPAAGGTAVTLSGSNFVTGATVTIGGTAATNVSVVNATTITATTPAHAAGTVDVTVTNPDSQSSTLSGGFTYTGGGTGGGEWVFGINSGGSNYVDGNGRRWYGDVAYSGGGTFSVSNAIAGTTDDKLYQSERHGNFSYTFNIDNGDYIVTLKFAEIYWSNPGKRVFDVTINGQLVLDNFDILSETARLTALDKSVPVTVSGGSMTIAFSTVTDNAKLSAIQVSTAGGGGEDMTPPTITSVNPANEATSVAPGSSIAVTFSEPMNQAATQAAISVNPTVSGTFGWDGAGTTMTFDPASDLAAETLYTVSLSTGATDLAGNALASATSWSFTTAGEGGGEPSLGQWTTMPPLPEPRAEVGVVEAGGLIYVLGGGSPTGLSNDVFVYDPVAQTWSEAAPYPGPAVDHAGAASFNGIVYLIGGLTSWPNVAVNTVLAYNPATNTWTQRASLPRDRGAMGIAVMGGKIYAAGGLIDGGTAVADLTVYDPATDTWTELAPMSVPRDHLVAEAVNGKIHALGGRPVTINAPVTAHEAYDPATNTWQNRAPLPVARGGHGSAVLDGKIVIFGGEGNIGDPSGTFENTDEYDPGTNTWRALAPMITPRHGMDGAVHDNVIYVPGGGPTVGGSSSVAHEAFSILTETSMIVQSVLSLGFLITAVTWFELSHRRQRRE